MVQHFLDGPRRSCLQHLTDLISWHITSINVLLMRAASQSLRDRLCYWSRFLSKRGGLWWECFLVIYSFIFGDFTSFYVLFSLVSFLKRCAGGLVAMMPWDVKNIVERIVLFLVRPHKKPSISRLQGHGEAVQQN